MLVKPQTPTMPAANWQKTPDMWKMMWFMNVFLVIMIWWLVWQMEAAIGLYLCTTTLFSVVQYTIQYRSILYAKWLEYTKWKQGVVVEKK
jgi:membrane protein insertase Oxa1/YidC/SpoIIIJ